MPKILYRKKNFSEKTREIIRRANQICTEYARDGYDLTLRQLYYVFVTRNWLANKQANYQRLGDIINDARYAGLIDWEHVVDRTRNLRFLRHWNDPSDAIDWMKNQYQIDKWEDQPNRIEVWIEKDALVGVLQAACNPEDVPYFSCRGYTSASEVWGAAQRIRKMIEAGQRVVILHLGDHDPSGVDMTRDIQERLFFFIASDIYKSSDMTAEEAVRFTEETFEVKRIALTMDQVQQYNPPPNPAKPKDARYKKYVERYGRDCWELDALPPNVLVALIRDEIEELRDADLWEAQCEREDEQLALITKVSKHWGKVSETLAAIEDEGSAA